MTSPSSIPRIGLGTFGRTGDEGLKALLLAIEIGYRHLDTAQSYGTEENVGKAVRQSALSRDELFVTTKVADTKLDKAQFMPSIEQSLKTLGLDYVDLLLIHWPSEKDAVPFEDYMTGLAEAKQRGFVKQIGVSNYPIADLDRADALLGKGALATDQVELHPYLQSPKLRDNARARGLMLTAYQPLAKGEVRDDPVLNDIAAKHGSTASAVSLAFLLAEGHAVIPASGSEGNLRSNFAAKDLTLSEDEIGRIRQLDRGYRRINPTKSPRWDD